MVLFADPSPEGHALADALRDRGFAVVATGFSNLKERVERLSPRGIVVAIDQADDLPSAADFGSGALAFIGDRGVAERRGLPDALLATVLAHPVEVDVLVGILEQPRQPPTSDRGEDTGARESGDGSLLTDFPAIAGLPEVESILPDFDSGPLSGTGPVDLSPEIEALLRLGAERVREMRPGSNELSLDEQAPVPVPAEMLASIDELLSTDDESPATTAGLPSDWAPRPGDEPVAGAVRRDPTDPPSSTGGYARRDRTIPGIASPTESAPGGRVPQPPDTPPESDVARHRPRRSPSEITNVGGAASQREAPVGVGIDTELPSPHIRTGAPGTIRAPHPHPWFKTAEAGPTIGAPPPDFGHSGARPVHDAVPRRGEAAQDDSGPGDDGHDHSGQGDDGQGDDEIPSEDLTPAVSEVESGPMTRAHMPSFVALPGEWKPDVEERRQGDPIVLLAQAVAGRATGALALVSADGERMRRIVLRDGDFVTAASGCADESLAHFLVERGDLSPELASSGASRLPKSGRHAAAAMIANGFLSQDDLWPVLRAHAEWIVSRAMSEPSAQCELDAEPAPRLRAEPSVFGGAAGVEVFVETVRRVLSAQDAIARLGGADAVLRLGPKVDLLSETALDAEEVHRVRSAEASPVGHVLAPTGADFAATLFALVALGVLESSRPPAREPVAESTPFDPLDADAVRRRVVARLALVHEADYFALLGLTPHATPYEIKRAYLDLRRSFEPSRLLNAATADLADEVQLIVDVLDEAYQILRDPQRRRRYRNAMSASP